MTDPPARPWDTDRELRDRAYSPSSCVPTAAEAVRNSPIRHPWVGAQGRADLSRLFEAEVGWHVVKVAGFCSF